VCQRWNGEGRDGILRAWSGAGPECSPGHEHKKMARRDIPPRPLTRLPMHLPVRLIFDQ